MSSLIGWLGPWHATVTLADSVATAAPGGGAPTWSAAGTGLQAAIAAAIPIPTRTDFAAALATTVIVAIRPLRVAAASGGARPAISRAGGASADRPAWCPASPARAPR